MTMDIATLPLIHWSSQRCPECAFEAFAQSRLAVLEAVTDHQHWMQARDQHVHRQMAWPRQTDGRPLMRKPSA